ncbi:MAG: hypothetical protein ACKO1T_08030 [Sediminibacterium sp.]
MNKGIFLSFFLLMSSEIVSGQAIYNMSGEEICVLKRGNFISGGRKIGSIQHRAVYDSIGKRLGSVENLLSEGREVSLYNKDGKRVCTINPSYLGGFEYPFGLNGVTEFYRGGDPVGFLRDNLIHNSFGKEIGYFQRLTAIEIAVYLFLLPAQIDIIKQ